MKKYIELIFLLIISTYSYSQVDTSLMLHQNNKVRTANTKDILTDLYRASIENLLGDDRSFTFSASFFGIDSICKSRNSEDYSFKMQKFLRDNSFNISIGSDSNNRINQLGTGFVFTLINARDLNLTQIKEMKILIANIHYFASIRNYINRRIDNSDGKKNEISSTWGKSSAAGSYKLLHPKIKDELKKLLENSSELNEVLLSITEMNGEANENDLKIFIQTLINGNDVIQEDFLSIAKKYDRKPVWTLTPTWAYDRLASKNEFTIGSNFIVGLGKKSNKKAWEFEAKSHVKFGLDTIIDGSKFKNNNFQISLGINKVLLENDEQESKMELKIFSQLKYQLSKIPSSIDKSKFDLNGTLRINVYKSLWLPITLTYDPINGNLAGVFSVTANLGD